MFFMYRGTGCEWRWHGTFLLVNKKPGIWCRDIQNVNKVWWHAFPCYEILSALSHPSFPQNLQHFSGMVRSCLPCHADHWAENHCLSLYKVFWKDVNEWIYHETLNVFIFLFHCAIAFVSYCWLVVVFKLYIFRPLLPNQGCMGASCPLWRWETYHIVLDFTVKLKQLFSFYNCAVR